MGLELFRDFAAEVPERIIVYGRAGIGKSTFSLMLPDKWGEILYYAADDSGEFLRSIPQSARDRVHVIKPRGADHHKNFQEFCMRDWKKIKDTSGKMIPDAEQPYRNVKTLVIDTFTTVSYRVIQQLANEQSIAREEHFIVGDLKNGGFALPTRSDYQGIESAIRGYIDMLFDKQREYNIILVCHEESKEIAKGKFVGGPSVPGKKMAEDLPASFNTVIRLVKDPVVISGTLVQKLTAVTENDGFFIGKLREGDFEGGNRLSRVQVERNPVTYWNRFVEYTQGGKRE